MQRSISYVVGQASKHTRRAIVAALLLGATGLTAADAGETATYQNPLFGEKFADPSVIRIGDTLYAYASGVDKDVNDPTPLVLMTKSTDMVTWSEPVTIMQRPSWQDSGAGSEGANVVAYSHGGQTSYVLYFTTAANGGHCIGAATSNSPDAGFAATDKPIVCGPDEHVIGPDVVRDQAGKWWMYYGSLMPMKRLQLDPDDITKSAGGSSENVLTAIPCDPQFANAFAIGGNGFESPWVIEHSGYNYVFSSGAFVGGGPRSYKIFVARSKIDPDNPSKVNFEWHHEDKAGADYSCKNAKENKIGPAIPVLQDRGKGNLRKPDPDTGFPGDWVNPGSNATFTDGAGNDWIVYAAWRYTDANLDKQAPIRQMSYDRLKWDSDGWPYVEGGAPSTDVMPAPVPYGNGG